MWYFVSNLILTIKNSSDYKLEHKIISDCYFVKRKI